MAVHAIKRGLNLPVAGEPAQTIGPVMPVRRVALLGADYVGLKPALRVQPGDVVQRGQALFEDRRRPGVIFAAPAAAPLPRIDRGDRRAFVSLVIEVAAAETQVAFTGYTGRPPEQLDADGVRALLLESGLWTAFRMRPFSRIPGPGERCGALSVTAIDTRPHAASPGHGPGRSRCGPARGPRLPDAARRRVRSSSAPTRSMEIEAPAGVRVERFAGPHPAGNAGLHIHRLHPASLERRVWHIGCQDVAAIGRLFLTGELDVERVISIAGPGVLTPRLLRTRLGAATDDLVRDGLRPGEQRVLSGSCSTDAPPWGRPQGYLGRYHLQVLRLAGGEAARDARLGHPLVPKSFR